LEYVTGIEPA